MDVVPLSEGCYHVLIAREMCHQSQLYLRVVGREQQAARVGYDSAPDVFTSLRTDRQVLQIRVARRESARRCHRLVISGVYLARRGVDERRQSIDIGRQ